MSEASHACMDRGNRFRLFLSLRRCVSTRATAMSLAERPEVAAAATGNIRSAGIRRHNRQDQVSVISSSFSQSMSDGRRARLAGWA